jgi:hypothetical protein
MKCRYCDDSMIYVGELSRPKREFFQCAGSNERIPFQKEGYSCPERAQYEINYDSGRTTWRTKE